MEQVWIKASDSSITKTDSTKYYYFHKEEHEYKEASIKTSEVTTLVKEDSE